MDKKMTTKYLWILFSIILLNIFILPSVKAEEPQEEINYKALPPQERWNFVEKQFYSFKKTLQEDPRHDVRKETIVNGNQIRILMTNQGSISTPNADAANADLVWPNGPTGLGYAYEFGPLVAAEVIGENGDTLHIVDDGFLLSADGDFDPGTSNKWGWEPKLGFSDTRSPEVATFSDLDSDLDGKPDSWPENWYNETLGRYVWPAFLGDDATTPDEEVFYKMDDFDNAEFAQNAESAYRPSPDDTTIAGLGLELEVRIFQFNNPLAEDLIFLVYTITNVSQKQLNKVFLGMFGDPHVGGPNDFSDDNAGFISAFDPSYDDRPNVRNMLYAWDSDGIGDGFKIPGYFGYRFLESPGIDSDGQDNDNDLLTDESQINDAGTFEFRTDFGIYRPPGFAWTGDEDGDWVEEFDDVGVDGIDGTGDYGEGDGKPNQLFYLDLNFNSILDTGEPTSETREEGMRFYGGEPNFGFLDIAESDQLGLTSFNAILFGGNNRPKNDPLMWDLMSTANQRPEDEPPTIEQEADNVFIYGSGPFSLKPGESQRFSISLLMGVDFDDLLNNAEISQQVFESDYRFAQAPNKPKVAAVPGDGKVTLYWDTGAETSFDPFVARANPDSLQKGFDFEGYRVYRSQDYSFNDTQTITDSKGVPFLSVPHKLASNLPAQWDLINEFQGLSKIEYQGRGVRYDLGNNTGLVHSFVDSNNVKNGVTYFYAVTSYDHGDVNAELPPTESQRTIQRDAVDRQFSFDINSVMVVPGGPAQGFVEPKLADSEDNSATREVGNATGNVKVQFLDPFEVKEGKEYDVFFEPVEIDSVTEVVGYSVVDLESRMTPFASRDTLFVNITGGIPFLEGSVSVSELSGATVDTSRYEVDAGTGRIRGTYSGALPVGESFMANYKIKPVASSTSMSNEDNNAVFDGLKVFVKDDATSLDPLSTEGGRSGFKSIETNTNFEDKYSEIGLAGVANFAPYPVDFEIRFTDYDTIVSGDLAGDLVSPADSSILTNVKTNFQIINTETSERIDFFIQETNPKFRNGRWDWVEDIILIKPGAPLPTETTYKVKFSPPSDTLKSSTGEDSLLVYQTPVYPGQGDVFLLFSKKPFDLGDKYVFKTKSASFDNEEAKNALEEIIVVPNPYVAFGAGEIAGIRSGDRDDRRIEFRNLPTKCTIRIYTIVGELVDTIEKDNTDNFATWDLLSFEAQEIAYGVYIYHVDAPGIGTKIGRFALIK
jgi:hypothetical protein